MHIHFTKSLKNQNPNELKKNKKNKNSHFNGALRRALLIDIITKQVSSQDVSGSNGYHLPGDKESSEAEAGIDENGSLELRFNLVVVK